MVRKFRINAIWTGKNRAPCYRWPGGGGAEICDIRSQMCFYTVSGKSRAPIESD